jgi:type III secretion protein N (ATPase)
MIALSDPTLKTLAGSRFRVCGKIREVIGPIVKANLIGVAVGDYVEIESRDNNDRILARIISFRDEMFSLSPLGKTQNILPGAAVHPLDKATLFTAISYETGTLLDAFGKVISSLGKSPKRTVNHRPASVELEISAASIARERLVTGVRTIDCFTPIAKGQRIAVFAEPGVGKSSLLQNLAHSSDVDIIVFALVGERRREVSELYYSELDEQTKSKSIIVSSTSAEPAIARVEAVQTAMAIAEYHRNKGKNVLLLVDSLTRLFRALREIGLAAGELPVRRGYPSSVFSALPALIERAGVNEKGTITAFYTVLLSSDLDEDPMVDEVKGLCDGHLILRRAIAERAIYPAIDITASLSRLAQRVDNRENIAIAKELSIFLQGLAEEKEMKLMTGRQDDNHRAKLELEKKIISFLNQGKDETSQLAKTHSAMSDLSEELTKLQNSQICNN